MPNTCPICNNEVRATDGWCEHCGVLLSEARRSEALVAANRVHRETHDAIARADGTDTTRVFHRNVGQLLKIGNDADTITQKLQDFASND